MKHQLKIILSALVFIPVFAFSQTSKNYITIGYSSICCGTPSEKPIMDFIKNFEKENTLEPFEMFIEGGLGYEGEYALYIGTDKLNAKLLPLFLEGLRITASNQNKQRSETHDGYVNLDTNLIPNTTIKTKKLQPTTE